MDFKSKEQVTLAVANLMFNLDKTHYVGFFRKTLNNMIKFWSNISRRLILR